jgi:hypothetical protein
MKNGMDGGRRWKVEFVCYFPNLFDDSVGAIVFGS